ncbi:MAG: sulfatase-like hydrolase/transferase, partial [Polaribacter sp.]
FLLPATGDRVPTVFVENHNAINLDPKDPIQISYKKPFPGVKTGITNPELLRQAANKQHSEAIVNGISRIGHQTGGKSGLWTDENFPYIFTEKANNFIENNKENPFFLFFSFHDIHVPRLPNKQFEGKSTMGPRGDAIVQMDWITGQVIQKLEKLGLDKNTLVIFTSDNGPVLNDGYEDLAVEKLGNHKPSGPFRGGKYSSFEAGTRVPMISYWPGTIKPGESNALFSQIDYYASLGDLVNQKIAKNEALDSKNIKNALLKADGKGRNLMLEEGFTLSIRSNNYKYIAPLEAKKFPAWLKNKKVEGGLSKKPQLYDLSKDIGELNNIAKDHKNLVDNLQSKIDSIVALSLK